jgi:hypothetical protein
VISQGTLNRSLDSIPVFGVDEVAVADLAIGGQGGRRITGAGRKAFTEIV